MGNLLVSATTLKVEHLYIVIAILSYTYILLQLAIHSEVYNTHQCLRADMPHRHGHII